MKTPTARLFIPLLVISLFLLFQSCGNENMVTQPLEKPVNKTPMAKTAVSQISSADTLITLPKSGKTILISKNLLPNEIKKIDKYLAGKKIANGTSQIQPYTSLTLHTTSWWELEDQFEPEPGKSLGIWTNDITFGLAHQFGYTKIYVNNNADIDTAYNNGFDYDNMMLGLTNYSNAFTQIDASNSNGRHVGSYLIDEPIERGTWDDYTIESVANYVPSKRVMLCSYKWPSWYYSFPNLTFGDMYGPIINSYSNIYIMCDEYYGNCLGHTFDYWNEFHGYYGSTKNITNFFHVVINNGNGSATSCGYAATSWITLLTTADGLGINEVWLYAEDTGNEDAIINCSVAAWQEHWLYRYAKHVVAVYQCSGPNCVWGESGDWSINNMYYDGDEGFKEY